MLYACDERWWRLRGPTLDEFKGLRYIGLGGFPGCVGCNVVSGDDALRWSGPKLGAGANSGYQALNLALMTGASRVVLLGYDMQLTDGQTHNHGDHGQGLSNPTDRMLAGCRQILDRVAPEIADRGVEVLNASRATALRAYPRVSLEEALA